MTDGVKWHGEEHTDTDTIVQWNDCPYCGFDSIQGGSLTVDGLIVFQGLSCNRCFETWTEVYQALKRVMG